MTSTTPARRRPAQKADTTLQEARRSSKVGADDAGEQAPLDEGGLEDHLVLLLLSIYGRDAAAGQLDSGSLGRRLGWTTARTAAVLDAAKGRLLIWGIRVGGSPAPCFEDIELTVQGRRIARAAAA